MKNSITQITENFIKNILEILQENSNLNETEKKIKLNTENLATGFVKIYIEQLDKEILNDKKMRKEAGYNVERREDSRSIMFSYGQVNFNRTYYKKASGDYEYLTDMVIGVNSRDRISENLLCDLAFGAKDMSYAKASEHIINGKISRQTVMNCVRESQAKTEAITEKREVSEPHIGHILATRLSTRPMAWSKTTLKQLAPILAAGDLTLNRKVIDDVQSVPLSKAAARASKALLSGTGGLPQPDAVGTLQINGKISSLQKVLKYYC